MGDDTALPLLAGRARPLYSYFRQRFAQVTNPPIDHLRERHTFSLRCILGGRAPLLTEGPETARGTEFESFFLYPDALDERLQPARRDLRVGPRGRLPAARRRGRGVRALGPDGAAGVGHRRGAGRRFPMLLAVGAVHHRLVARGLRSLATLVVETDEAREAHHLACLLGYGAEAICPRLALETVAALAAADKVGGDRPSPAEAQERFRAAIEDGVLKIMSKMGIADVAAYCGAQVFDVLGLAQEVVDLCFAGTPRRSAASASPSSSARRSAGSRPRDWRTPATSSSARAASRTRRTRIVVDAAHALRLAVRKERREAYERFAELVDGRAPMELRDLLELRAGRAGPARRGRARRVDRAALLGGRDVARRALGRGARDDRDRVQPPSGARSNCGEGGEDPARFRTERNSRIKQIASGRFGVTPEYAAFADELQIKIAQGSKPGEGGQLPGHKVSVEIARLRHTHPGRRADLAAAAPRHLLDRGPRAADLRPPAGEPERGDLGEARRRDRRRPRRRAASSRRSPTSSTSPARTAAPARARSRRSRTPACRGSSGSPRRSARWSRTACAGVSGCVPTAGSRPAATSSSPRCSAPTRSASARRSCSPRAA